jgi:hypothetical protein
LSQDKWFFWFINPKMKNWPPFVAAVAALEKEEAGLADEATPKPNTHNQSQTDQPAYK